MDGDSLLFEVFRKSGKYYVRPTINGRAVYVNGNTGVMELDDFQEYLYPRTYAFSDGSVSSVCSGVENPDNHKRPIYGSWTDYKKAQYGEEEEVENDVKVSKHHIILDQD